MPKKSLSVTPELLAYISQHTVAEPPLLQALRTRAQHYPGAHMLTPWPTMQYLCFWVRVLQPKIIVEIGTYAGYSAVAFALATEHLDTTIHTLDRDLSFFRETEYLWTKHSIAPRIVPHEGPGLDILKTWITPDKLAQFYYVDANKDGYADYYQHIKRTSPPGTAMAFDNTLSQGQVLHPHPRQYTKEIQAFNKMVREDAETYSTLLPIGDGLTLVITI